MQRPRTFPKLLGTFARCHLKWPEHLTLPVYFPEIEKKFLVAYASRKKNREMTLVMLFFLFFSKGDPFYEGKGKSDEDALFGKKDEFSLFPSCFLGKQKR